MEKIENATKQMITWAEDASHGYDQANRWGPDYDCSSAVIEAWERAGVPVKAQGASYTGNMYEVFTRCGFANVTAEINLATGAGLQRGDVLLNHQRHTAMFCGGGLEVEASINELGSATGGEPGDQTGREFLVRPYRNYPWDCILRYTGEDKGASRPRPTYEYSVKLGLLKPGMEDTQVETVQELLAVRGYYTDGINGIMDEATVKSVRAFQERHGLEVDGEVGGQTWSALLKSR